MPQEIKLTGENVLFTSGGTALTLLLRMAVESGWGGLEFLAGVPGTVGGAVFMNAGTHLGEVSTHLLKVECLALDRKAMEWKFQTFNHEEFKYTYRAQHFMPTQPDPYMVWSCEWKIEKQASDQVKELISKTLDRRKQTQPIDYPSCGSVFKNPSKTQHAWQIIEKIGLRGYRRGDAQISEKHSNFIINHGYARAEDVKFIIEEVKRRARQELGIEMEEEVQCLGF